MSDPFDWPFPQRRDLMSLSTLKNNEFAFNTQPKHQKIDYNLKVSDINGAQPLLKAYYNYKHDIRGASPKQLIKPSGRQDNQLFNQDIKGTQPQINKFITTREPSNPLEPFYRIPKVEQRIPTPPKFIRDNINIDDIEGTKPMPNFTRLRKNIIVFDEIEGSKPKSRFQPRDHIEIMDVKDINNYREFKSTRLTNPLQPIYTVQNDVGEKVQIGDIQGSKSRQLHPVTINKVASTTLTTLDIGGAQAGTHAQIFLRSNDRKHFRESNLIVDVPGAQSGTLKKGMSSVRRTNPLQPSYQIPGYTEIQPTSVFTSSAGNNLARTQSQQVLNKNEPKLASAQSSAKLTTAQKLDSFIAK